MALSLPPWLTPSDPAPAAARGFQLGLHAGAQQASQRFQQMQMARMEQQDAMQQARWDAEMGLKAAEMARKHQAQMAYRQAIEGGMDPLDAMIRFGPEMGQQASAEAAAIAALAKQKKAIPTWEKKDFDGASVLMSSDGRVMNLPKPTRPAAEWETREVTDERGQPLKVQVDKTTGSVKAYPSASSGTFWQESWSDREELRAVESDLNKLEEAIFKAEDSAVFQNAAKKDPEKRSPYEAQRLSIVDGWKSRADSLKSQVKALRDKYRPAGHLTGGLRILNIRPKPMTESSDEESE